MTLAVVVQARARSTRLPGKATAVVFGRPLLAWMLDRVKSGTMLADSFVVACPTGDDNDQIAAVATRAGWDVVRGPENDVIRRVLLAADSVHAEGLAFMGADQPLIDPETINSVLAAFVAGHRYVRTTGQPWGLQAWAVGREELVEACVGARDPEELEHTGAYWDQRPDQYPCHVLRSFPDESGHRLTVDTPADLELHRKIISTLAPRWPRVTTQDILDLLKRNPGWEAETRHVKAWRWDGYDEAVANG